MICSSRRCKSGRPGVWEPIILLWPDRHDGAMWQPASVQMHGFLLCEECRVTARPIDMLSGKTWKKIKVDFWAQGKAMPSLQTAKLTFVLPDSLKLGGIKV